MQICAEYLALTLNTSAPLETQGTYSLLGVPPIVVWNLIRYLVIYNLV